MNEWQPHEDPGRTAYVVKLEKQLNDIKAIAAKWVPNPPDQGGWYDPYLAKSLMDDICDVLGWECRDENVDG